MAMNSIDNQINIQNKEWLSRATIDKDKHQKIVHGIVKINNTKNKVKNVNQRGTDKRLVQQYLNCLIWKPRSHVNKCKPWEQRYGRLLMGSKLETGITLFELIDSVVEIG